MALVTKTMHHDSIIENIFTNTELLKKEANLDKDLAAILVTELLWGKKLLQGESKPVQTIMKYRDELLSAVEIDDLAAKDEQCLNTSTNHQLITCIEKEEIFISKFQQGEIILCSRLPKCFTIHYCCCLNLVWRPRYVRVNTIRQSPDAVINYFAKNAWTKLKVPESYSEYIELIKSRLKESTFIQDYHMKEILLFPFGTVFAENRFYQNGTIVLQDKVNFVSFAMLIVKCSSSIFTQYSPTYRYLIICTY